MIAKMFKASLRALPNRRLLVVCASLLASNLFAAEAPRVPAFPGAEGYGAMTRGGRGGRVIAVTNLNDSGQGSLRAAVEAEGPRIVVFRISGTITLESRLRISNPYITIAGQTAPGDGVTIRKYQLQIAADEVVIRYIRVRLGGESGDDADAISSRYHKNIILDHVSASWSVDETVLSIQPASLYPARVSDEVRSTGGQHRDLQGKLRVPYLGFASGMSDWIPHSNSSAKNCFVSLKNSSGCWRWGPCPPFGTIQRKEFGIERYISSGMFTGKN